MLILYSPPFFMRVSASEKPGTTCATCIGACSFASKTVPSSSLPSYLTSTTSALVGLGPVPSLTISNPMRGVMCQANAAATPMSASTPSHSSHNPPLLTGRNGTRSEEHTSELQSLMRISYAVFCLKKKKTKQKRETKY